MDHKKIIFVPGGNILPFNELEGTFTLLRLIKGLELWQTGDYDVIVVSDGRFWPSNISNRALARIMRDWLLAQKNGPSDDDIVIEVNSRDTYENIHFSVKKILDWLYAKHRISSKHFRAEMVEITVVTEKHHGQRILTTWQKSKRGHRWPNIQLVDAGYRLSPIETVKEILFGLIHKIDPMGRGWLANKNRHNRTFQN